MNRLMICAASLLVGSAVLVAQQAAPAAPKAPASPAATESATIGGKAITIKYSSPGVKGRAGKLFGQDGLIGHDPHYPIWRAGANAATALHTDADIEIGGLPVPKGDYTLFVDLSDPANWQLVISKATGEWGLAYNADQDLGRVAFTMARPPELVENLKYTLTDLGGGKGTLTLAWENRIASVAVVVHSK